MNQQLRERFEEKKNYLLQYWLDESEIDSLLAFIENEIIEAERRMKERFKKAIIIKEEELCELFTSNRLAAKVILEEAFNSISPLWEHYSSHSTTISPLK